MKNPHGAEPSRYMKRTESECAILCIPEFGPLFNDDISIDVNCNRENSCYINNDDTNGYECHPEYKSSLFVNSAGTDRRNYFSVLDYEVYTNN